MSILISSLFCNKTYSENLVNETFSKIGILGDKQILLPYQKNDIERFYCEIKKMSMLDIAKKFREVLEGDCDPADAHLSEVYFLKPLKMNSNHLETIF